MKNKKLEMKRDDWEHFRQYRQANYQKRYLEILSLKKKNKALNHYNLIFNNYIYKKFKVKKKNKINES